ncbi:Conserved_hypothetical protein [Hexamita inflata]|uniref:Uncharacterized protein n=1 Tax=Hexamita inflata TaxID=28002 RepID=A0AA86U1S4_9EUKA|nr:Conserved hypothetical protein [Hexamita inflata]
MFSSITIFTQLKIQQTCLNQIHLNDQKYSYCAKFKHLSNLIINSELQIQSNKNSIFLFTEQTTNSRFDIQLNNQNQFYLFGFDSKNQNISNSILNVSVQIFLWSGALICDYCSIIINNCTLIFNASGVKLAGIANEIITLQMKKCVLQYRFNCNQSAGIAIKMNNCALDLENVKIIGFTNTISGYIGYQVNIINLTYNKVQICTSEQEFGESSGSVQIIGSVIKDCKDVCTNAIPTYGLCLDDLQYGSIVDYQSVCLDPFEFVNHTCVCKYGYILAQSKCVNVVDSLINLDLQLLQNISYVNNTIDSNFATLDGQLASNYSLFDNQLNSTKSQLELNISILRDDIQHNLEQNLSNIEHAIINNNTYISEQIRTNTVQTYVILESSLSQLNLELNSKQQKLDQQYSDSFIQIEQKMQQIFDDIQQQMQNYVSILNQNIDQTYKEYNTDVQSYYSIIDYNIFSNFTSLYQQLSDSKNIVNKQLDDVDNQLKQEIARIKANIDATYSRK